MMCRTLKNKTLPWQHLITMVIGKICKMTVKSIKLNNFKSESFSSISYGVFELWRKTLRWGEDSATPGPDRVNNFDTGRTRRGTAFHGKKKQACLAKGPTS